MLEGVSYTGRRRVGAFDFGAWMYPTKPEPAKPRFDPNSFATTYAPQYRCNAVVVPPQATANEVLKQASERRAFKKLRNGRKRVVIRIATNTENSFMLLSQNEVRRMFGGGAPRIQP